MFGDPKEVWGKGGGGFIQVSFEKELNQKNILFLKERIQNAQPFQPVVIYKGNEHTQPQIITASLDHLFISFSSAIQFCHKSGFRLKAKIKNRVK